MSQERTPEQKAALQKLFSQAIEENRHAVKDEEGNTWTRMPYNPNGWMVTEKAPEKPNHFSYVHR